MFCCAFWSSQNSTEGTHIPSVFVIWGSVEELIGIYCRCSESSVCVCVRVLAAVVAFCTLFLPCLMDYRKFCDGLKGQSLAVGGGLRGSSYTQTCLDM